jgi:hypothetical protein
VHCIHFKEENCAIDMVPSPTEFNVLLTLAISLMPNNLPVALNCSSTTKFRTSAISEHTASCHVSLYRWFQWFSLSHQFSLSYH